MRTSTPLFGKSVAEDRRAVRRLEDRLADVLADLAHVDVEGRDDLDVLGAVAADLPVQQPDRVVGLLGRVVLEALDQRARAVADPDDRDLDPAHSPSNDPACRGARACELSLAAPGSKQAGFQ